MAQRVRPITEILCDRCDRRIVKSRKLVILQNHGVDTLEKIQDAPNDHCALDLCKPCEDSLRKWWARGGKDEESEAAQ